MKASVKRNISLYVTLVAIGLLFMGSFSCILSIASHEQFKVISAITPSPVVSSDVSWIEYKNNYFSLSYPSSAKEQILEKDANPAVVASRVVYQSNPHIQIATQVLREPDMTSITDFPAVAFRHIKSDIYTQNPVTVGGIAGVEFYRHASSDNPSEFGAFLFKDHVIYAFVVQGRDEAYADQTYRRMLSTISFTNELK